MIRFLKHFILLLSLLIAVSSSYAQQKYLDSILVLLKTDKQDTNRVNHLNAVSDEFRKISEVEKGLQYANDALVLSQELKFKKGIGVAHSNIGLIYETQSNYAKALQNILISLKIREEISDKKGIANAYNNIGIIYTKQNNYTKALENYLASLKIKKELGDKKGIANSYNNIGTIYKEQRKPKEALENYQAALTIFIDIDSKKGIAASYNNIGNIYFNLNDYPKALESFQSSLKLKEKIGDKLGISIAYTNIGNVNFKQLNFPEAKENQLTALAIAKEINAKNIIVDASGAIARCDSATGNFKSAFTYYKLYKQYNDSIFNEESDKKTTELSAQFESDKKDNEIKLLNVDKEKQAAITEAESKKQRIIIWSVASGLLLVIIFSLFIYNRWRVTQQQKIIIEKQKHLVEEKQQEVLDSIRYAKRIQTSLLPTEKYLERVFSTLKKS